MSSAAGAQAVHTHCSSSAASAETSRNGFPKGLRVNTETRSARALNTWKKLNITMVIRARVRHSSTGRPWSLATR